jgi:hypothetical protein
MIKLDLKHFANIRQASLHDDSAVSLIIGYNESGKTSLIGSIEYAFTGSAFGLRGEDIKNEVTTHGEDGLHVRVYVDGMTINRSPSSGDAVKGIAERLGVPAAVMPLLFNSALCGDGGDKAMRVFLDGVASSKFDAALHFAADPIISQCISKAKSAGKVTTKHQIEFCESLRALQKEPSPPTMPLVPNPTDDEIAKAQLATQTESARLVEATNTYREYEVNGQIILKIVQHQRDMEAYEKLRALSSITDSLGDKRARLEQIANINIKTLEAVNTILHNAAGDGYFASVQDTFSDALESVQRAITEAKSQLAANPPAPSAPRLPTMSPDVAAVYDSLKADNLLTNEGLAAISKAALEGSNAALELKRSFEGSITALRNHEMLLNVNRGAWSYYYKALPEYESAKAKATADWEMWSNAAKAITAAENEHINKAGDAFGSMVSEFSGYVLQGRKVVINRDTGVSLGGVRIGRCSKSAQWRMEVSIMAAIARTLKSPLLIIDAADILDERNKTKMQEFLLERIVPFFKHVILTATCRGKIEDEKPSADSRITKWLMRDGQLSRLAATSSASN